MYYPYILLSRRDGEMYVGCTGDLRKRLLLHNSGKVLSTKNRIPLEVIYYEAYKNRNDAFARERFLKTGWGRNYIQRVLKNYFTRQNPEHSGLRWVKEFKNLGG